MSTALCSFQNRLLAAVFVGIILGSVRGELPAQTAEPPAAEAAAELRPATLGSIQRVHAIGNLYLAGQFKPEDLPALQAAGIRQVITLRTEGELKWDEQAVVEQAGLRFRQIPLQKPAELSAAQLDEVREALRLCAGEPTLLHCGSATRAAAAWLAYRALDQQVPLDDAVREARQAGLQSADWEKSALTYTVSQLQERAAQEPKKTNPPRPTQAPDNAPGDINAPFLDPKLDVAEFLKRFEVESREIYQARQEIVKMLNLQPNQIVADIGAGTGLFTRQLSPLVGDAGRVFAVEIAPAFLQHINATAEKQGLHNITPVLCSQRSTYLPANALDLAFICDTYHHFNYPADALASIFRALKPGGELVVVDFIREEGVSSEWILSHVRAGQAVVRQEIEAAGFEFVEEPAIPGLRENYALRFRKPLAPVNAAPK